MMSAIPFLEEQKFLINLRILFLNIRCTNSAIFENIPQSLGGFILLVVYSKLKKEKEQFHYLYFFLMFQILG